jgi:hypothetical protein
MDARGLENREDENRCNDPKRHPVAGNDGDHDQPAAPGAYCQPQSRSSTSMFTSQPQGRAPVS